MGLHGYISKGGVNNRAPPDNIQSENLLDPAVIIHLLFLFLIRTGSSDRLSKAQLERHSKARRGTVNMMMGPELLKVKSFVKPDNMLYANIGAWCQHGEEEGDFGYDNPCIY